MNILVFSDSHGNLENLYNVIDNFNYVDIIFHLGDFIQDSNDILNKYPNIKTYGVSGNNDYPNNINERIVNVDGYSFFLTHGDKYNVYYGINNIYYKAKQEHCDFAFFGHTHKKFLYQDDITILNPGSISFPRDSNIPNFAYIELNEKISIKFFGVFKEGIKEVYL